MRDELWVGVKGQSNSVIAGLSRNAFRCSVTCFTPEVELLEWPRGPPRFTEVSQLECGV